jgi:hypothetical protein
MVRKVAKFDTDFKTIVELKKPGKNKTIDMKIKYYVQAFL